MHLIVLEKIQFLSLIPVRKIKLFSEQIIHARATAYYARCDACQPSVLTLLSKYRIDFRQPLKWLAPPLRRRFLRLSA